MFGREPTLPLDISSIPEPHQIPLMVANDEQYMMDYTVQMASRLRVAYDLVTQRQAAVA